MGEAPLRAREHIIVGATLTRSSLTLGCFHLPHSSIGLHDAGRAPLGRSGQVSSRSPDARRLGGKRASTRATASTDMRYGPNLYELDPAVRRKPHQSQKKAAPGAANLGAKATVRV